MADNQNIEGKNPPNSPVAKQIVWIGSIALVLTLAVVFLIIRPHYVKIQNEIASQKDQLRLDMETLKNNDAQTIAVLENENKELEKTIAGLQAAQQKHALRIQQLNQEMETADAHLRSLENEQNDLKVSQKNLEAEKSKLKNALSKTEEEKSALDAELKKLRSAGGQMTVQEEKAMPGMTESWETDRIAGTQIILHYSKEDEDKAKQVMDKLVNMGARIQSKIHKSSKASKLESTICHYKGSQAYQAAVQIKESLADVEPLKLVESKVWWFWIDMNKLNLWL